MEDETNQYNVLLTLEHQSDRPVIDEFHLHMCLKNSGAGD